MSAGRALRLALGVHLRQGAPVAGLKARQASGWFLTASLERDAQQGFPF